MNNNGGVNRFDKHAQVKLDHFPIFRGKHKQYLKPPPSLDSFPLFLVGKNLLQGTGHHPRNKFRARCLIFGTVFPNAIFKTQILKVTFDFQTCLPWEPITFIFRGYNPYFGGVKPSFFMVLGSHGSRLSSLLPLLHQCSPLRMRGIRSYTMYIFAYVTSRKINHPCR